MSSGTHFAMRCSRDRGRTMFQTSILVLLTLVPAVLSLAISPRAEANTEVRSISEPLGMAVSLGGIGLSASSSSPNVGAAIARNSETGGLAPLVEPSPTVTSVTPNKGSTVGGTEVTIQGTGFGATILTNTVTIGGSPATVTAASATSLTVTAPSGSAGPASVVVTNTTDGLSVIDAGAYTYVAPPSVGKVEPAGGPAAGGTKVTIAGSNLTGATEVKFGASIATIVKVTESSIEAVSPVGTGTVDVIVTTPGGPSTASSADQFTYVPPAPPGTVEPPGQPPGGGPPGGGVSGPTTIPAPVLAQSANIAPVAGRVRVRLPGTPTFVTLSRPRQIPYRTVVEATHGEVSVTAATPNGGTQRGQFFDGQFVLSQSRSGRVLATMTGGDFSVCPHRARAAGAALARRTRPASGTHLVRRLWADARGNFSTKGKYAAGIVRGAQWLTEDTCQGTLILAIRDHVEVTDIARHRHIKVPAGDIYLAKAR